MTKREKCDRCGKLTALFYRKYGMCLCVHCAPIVVREQLRRVRELNKAANMRG